MSGVLVSPARPSHALPGSPETGSKVLREREREREKERAGPLEEINMKDRSSITQNLHEER